MHWGDIVSALGGYHVWGDIVSALGGYHVWGDIMNALGCSTTILIPIAVVRNNTDISLIH